MRARDTVLATLEIESIGVGLCRERLPDDLDDQRLALCFEAARAGQTHTVPEETRGDVAAVAIAEHYRPVVQRRSLHGKTKREPAQRRPHRGA